MSEFVERTRVAGSAPSIASPRSYEPSPEERAHAAAGVAANLERAHEYAVELLDSLPRLHDANDAVGYARTRELAQQAAERVLDLAKASAKHVEHAADASVRTKLEQAETLAANATKKLAAVPGPPTPSTPRLRSEHELLSALPPLIVEGSAKQVFDAARRAVPQVMRQMPFTDFAVFELLLRNHPDHEISRRFRRFTSETQRALLAILKDPSARARARAIESSLPAMPEQGLASVAAIPPTMIVETAPTLMHSFNGHKWTTDSEHKAKQTPLVALQTYLSRESASVWSAVSAHLGASAWDIDVTERLSWNHEAFLSTLVSSLHDGAMKASKGGDLSVESLSSLLHPVDVVSELTPLLPITEEDEHLELHRSWAKAFGVRCGQLFQTAIVPSAKRMIVRYCAAADAGGAVPSTSQLVASSLLDQHVARALVASVSDLAPTAEANTTRPLTLRAVSFSWEGSRDSRLWNWVRADRADATAEEVAAAVTATGTLVFADQLAVAAPLFGLPAQVAASVPAARASSPLLAALAQQLPSREDTADRRIDVLAKTNLAEQLAVAQAGAPMQATETEIYRSIEDTRFQFDEMSSLLTPWGLSADVDAASVQLEALRNELFQGSPERRQAFAAVTFAQRERLGRILRSVRSLSSQVVPSPAHPLRSIIATYARATALSQMSVVSEQLIANAAADQAALSIRSLQANQIAAMQATGQGDSASAELLNRSHVIENQLLAGNQVEADEVELVQLQLQELTLRSRVGTIDTNLANLEQQTNKTLGSVVGRISASNKYESIPGMAEWLRERTKAVLATLEQEEQARDIESDASQSLRIKRTALTRAQASLTALQRDIGLEEFLRQAHAESNSQLTRTLIIGLALAIGLSIVTGGIASQAAAVVGEMVMTAQGVETITALSSSARFLVGATDFAVDTTLYAAGDSQLNGTSFTKSLAVTGFSNLATRAIAGPIGAEVRAASEWHAALEAEVNALKNSELQATSAVTRFGRAAGAHALAIGGHTALGLSLGAILSKVERELDPELSATAATGWKEVVLQAASVSIGRLVHGHAQADEPSLKEFARRTPEAAELVALDQHLIAQSEIVVSSELAPENRAARALDLIDRINELSQKRRALVERLNAHPEHNGYTPEELAGLREAIPSLNDASLLEAQLHLLGLHQLDGQALWSGTPRQIDSAVDRIAANDPAAHVERKGDRTTVSTAGGLYELRTVADHSTSSNALTTILSPLKAVIENSVYVGTDVQIQEVVHHARDEGVVATVDAEGVWSLESDGQRVDLLGESADRWSRKRHPADPPNEYQYNAMRPGPLTDPAGAKPWDPAAGFFGGAYDEIVVQDELTLYRVGPDGEGTARGLGRWYTDKPLQSEAQFRMDTAVKPYWKSADGTVATSEGITRAKSPADVSISVRVPTGTKIYRGPISPQSDIHLGGADVIQYYVPDPRVLKIESVQRFKHEGNQQPAGTAEGGKSE